MYDDYQDDEYDLVDEYEECDLCGHLLEDHEYGHCYICGKDCEESY